MKKTNLLLVLAIVLSGTIISPACKNKKAESTSTQDRTTNAPVEISSDDKLRQSVNDVLKDYNDVQAEVKDGVVILRGNVKQDELQTLIMKVQELRPKKIDNQLVIKT